MTAELTITELGAGHLAALARFFDALPEGDLILIKEDVTNPATVRSWITNPESAMRWVVFDADADETVVAFLAVRRLAGWSDHVGEIRLVVHPAHRRARLGTRLARHAVTSAVQAGIRKLVVELVADQSGALAMFSALGFTGEALLCDHIRDRDGELRDHVVLAHYVDETWSGMASVGLADELGRPAGDRP
jgi:ribosomal protein S18 acetylase RimI-like enzyme